MSAPWKGHVCFVQMVAAPHVIYTSSKADDTFLEKLQQGTGPNPDAHKFDVRLEKSSAFNAEGVSLMLSVPFDNNIWQGRIRHCH